MRACIILISATLWTSATALAAEEAGARVKLPELIAQGFEPKATGELVMARTLIPPMDLGIFVDGRIPSCIGAPIATMQDRMDTCRVSHTWTDKAEFHRMVKGDVEFVCVLYGDSECYPVH
jgi:hypothetical protein